jgi:hypothetical protein
MCVQQQSRATISKGVQQFSDVSHNSRYRTADLEQQWSQDAQYGTASRDASHRANSREQVLHSTENSNSREAQQFQIWRRKQQPTSPSIISAVSRSNSANNKRFGEAVFI